MPQLNQKQDARPIIKASLPNNISAVDKAKLEAHWNEQAAKREEAIAHETRLPTEPSMIHTYRICKYGKYWVAEYKNGTKFFPLMSVPSIAETAQNMILDKMGQDMIR